MNSRVYICFLIPFFLANNFLFGLSPNNISAVRERTVFIQTFDQIGNKIGSGSGFLISSNGDIATNYHVVQNAHKATVKFPIWEDNFEVLKIVQKSPKDDLAILRINWNFTKATPLELEDENSKPRIGEKIYAFGSPRGLEGSVSDGIISSYRSGWMQISTPISPGSSGGPIVNENGKVVGIATSGRQDSQNLNFAVPSWVLIDLWKMPHVNLPFKASNLPPIDEFRSSIDSIKMEIEREAIVSSLTPENLEELYFEAITLRDNGQYAAANANMDLIFQSLGKIPLFENEALTIYLILACQIKDKLEEPDHLINLAKRLLQTTSSDAEKTLAYGYIGKALLLKQQYEKALKYLSFALQSAIKIYGNEHPETSSAYNDVGMAYDNLGDYENAILHYKKSLGIYIKIDTTGSNIASLYNNIALVYDKQQKYEEAIGYYKESLSLNIQAYGTKHPQVATNYNNLGIAYSNLNDYKRAIAYLENALEINLSKLGEKHPKVGLALANIGDVYEKIGEFNKALQAYQVALSVFAGSSDAEPHPLTLDLYMALGRVYANAGMHEDAIGMREKELVEKIKVHGPKHLALFDTYYHLAMSNQNLDQHETAIKFFQEAIDLIKQSPESLIDYRITQARDRIAFSQYKMGHYRTAIGLYKKVIQGKIVTLGSKHEDLAFSYHYLALSYFAINDFNNALTFNEKALAINIAKYGEYGNEILASDYMEIGNCLKSKKEIKKAKDAYEKAYKIRRKFLGASDPFTLETLNAIKELN